MERSPGTIHKPTMLAAIAVTGLLLLGATSTPIANADHQPANKAAVAGSALEIMGTAVTEGSTSETVELMNATVRTSSTIDLLLQVTLECALWTNIMTIGDDESEAIATVNVWVEVDGEPVPVAEDDEDDPGKVVFCNRAYKMRTLNFDNNTTEIEQFLSTRSANAFNWMLIDAGSGLHDIVVKAELEAQVTGLGEAKAGIGKRTLVVEPLRLASHAEA